jgi:hypothetical protein
MFRILRSLDPHHARVGYLGAVATVATRGLDTHEALGARLGDLLFHRVYEDEPAFQQLLERVPPVRRDELMARMERQGSDDPWSAFGDAGRTRWLYASEFWLFDAEMPSQVGFLSKDQIDRPIDLAKWTNLLLPTYELSEVGYLVQHCLARPQSRQEHEAETFNPIKVTSDPCLRLLYLRLFLDHETLLPFLIAECVERVDAGASLSTRDERTSPLVRAVERMLSTAGDTNDPDQALPLRNVVEFQTSIGKTPSTRENYLRPRMEMLVDLGVFERKAGGPKGKVDAFPWQITDVARRLATEWRGLLGPHDLISRYLDHQYFQTMATVFNLNHKPVKNDLEVLLWFAKAFAVLGREFGFTPGRTLALKAALMAWESGRTIEIADGFDVVYRAAASSWQQYLHFSGGSRFDREFLVRIDDEIVVPLEAAIADGRQAL